MKGIIFGVIVEIITFFILVSLFYLYVALFTYIICFAFDIQFTFKVAVGVWASLVLLVTSFAAVKGGIL